jgi:hypothetical protein
MSVGQMVKSFKTSFELSFAGGDSDGVSFSFGNKNSLATNFDFGYTNGLSVRFSNFLSTYNAMIYEVRWDNQVISTISNWSVPSKLNVVIQVTDNGSLEMTLPYGSPNETVIAALPNWTTRNMTDWVFGYGGSTGTNVTGNVSIDNLKIFDITTKTTGSPLAFDLSGDGVQTLGLDSGVIFDLLGQGTPVQTGWIDREDALLVLDLNNNGHIDSGMELFGNATALAAGGVAKDGWEALAQYDEDQNGVIDARDGVFHLLGLWKDVDSNGLSTYDEIFSLADLGIVGISLQYADNAIVQNGNVLRDFSSYTKLDGTEYQVVDAWFEMVNADIVKNNIVI